MTQDITIKDRRRQTIDASREPTGRFYDQKLRFMMKVYESLEDTLRRKKVSSSNLQDLITIRSSFREKAYDFLDVLTFEILMNIDREMKSMNPHVAHYSYSSPDFIKFVWSLKDVTLPKNLGKLRSIKVQPLQMNVTMSNVLDLETASVRVLWFKRDFYSDYCPSYMPSSFDMKFQNFDSAIDEEMKMRKYFRDKRVAEMREAREVYEIKMEAIRQQEEADAKNKKNKEQKIELVAKKNLRIKVIKEPPIVDDSTYVNVDDEYLAYENQIVEEEMHLLSPDSLNLDRHDVNMRQYQILGGTYRIECLERPLQTKEIYQHLFVRLNERPNVLKYRNFHHIYEEPVLKNVKEERKTLFAEKLLDAKNKALLGLNKIEIKLSDKIIWWEEPMACRFEKWEESDEFLQLDPELQDYNLNYEKYKERELQSLFKMPYTQFQKRLRIEDFQLSAYPENIKISSLVRYFLAPILPNEFPHYVEKLEMFEKKEREWRFYKARHTSSGDYIAVDQDKDMKNTTIATVKILNDFLKIFAQKHSTPRELFPQKIKKHSLEIVENPELLLTVQKAREELQKILIIEEECEPEVANDIPLEKEPLMLSELLDRINNIQKSLKAVFKIVQNKIEEVPVEKPRRKSIKKIRMSLVPRKSLVTPRKSIKRTPKMRKSNRQKSFRIRSSLIEESNTSATEVNTESSTNDSKLFLIPHHKGKWVTKDIHESCYDEKTKTFSFYAGCCGVFGLAIRKYYNMPFKNWELYPIIEENEDKYVLMRIEGQKVSIEFKITLAGFTYKILKPGKVPRQELQKSVKIFELKKILSSLNVNLFPELDASWYVPNISEKHTAMEFHTYKSMAAFCLSYHFKYHECNRYGTRREIVLKSKLLKDQSFTDVLITPLKVLTVDPKVETTENYQMKLKYEENPPDQEFCADLYEFLKAEVDKTEHRLNQKSFMIFWHVQALLMNLRPLSFSQ
ncbi:unnamed protein product [Chironomus riparius]|uniref:CASC1 C-terminal domain-containing protein n=1 Tax=Chironomus riparius TaxID=315576 RepID=A0A9N9WT08_9DIPT|nr:unnamed protein product [Chironomus riparius]